MSDEIRVWKFLQADHRMRYDDGRLIEVGVPLSVEGHIETCTNGIHGSVRAVDALKYAPGAHVAYGALSGDVDRADDKVAGRTFTALTIFDATRILQEFAVWCAEQAIATVQAQGIEVDARPIDAINVVHRWLRDEATIEEVHAAYAADYAAAYAAAYAADAAAYAAARAAQNDELERLLKAQIGGAS